MCKYTDAVLNASATSSFYIGCDSSVYRTKEGKKLAKYVVVFIVHKNSNNGCSIIHDEYVQEDFGNLKQRLLNEVSYALNVASQVVDLLKGRKLEIHLDINPNPSYKSNAAIKEALAYVKGMGLEAKVKPYSFAATHAADHLT
jgi:hypothetical protein